MKLQWKTLFVAVAISLSIAGSGWAEEKETPYESQTRALNAWALDAKTRIETLENSMIAVGITALRLQELVEAQRVLIIDHERKIEALKEAVTTLMEANAQYQRY